MIHIQIVIEGHADKSYDTVGSIYRELSINSDFKRTYVCIEAGSARSLVLYPPAALDTALLLIRLSHCSWSYIMVQHPSLPVVLPPLSCSSLHDGLLCIRQV